MNDENKYKELSKSECDIVLKSVALYGLNKMIDVNEIMKKIAKIKVNLAE